MHGKLIGSWHSAPVTALQPKLALSPGHPRPEARGLHPGPTCRRRRRAASGEPYKAPFLSIG